jgi:hypothetical protein
MLKYMDDFGFITTYQAVLDLGIASPTKRISELRQRGENIVGETIYSKNRYGEKTHYNKYRRG